MAAQAEQLSPLVVYFKLNEEKDTSKTGEIMRAQNDTQRNLQTSVATQSRANLSLGKNTDDSDWQKF
ncbi:MAG: hypothetical protein ACI9ZT_000455 [Gammaproteobacteria bacterium]|jgi:hypothetical protein